MMPVWRIPLAMCTLAVHRWAHEGPPAVAALVLALVQLVVAVLVLE